MDDDMGRLLLFILGILAAPALLSVAAKWAVLRRISPLPGGKVALSAALTSLLELFCMVAVLPFFWLGAKGRKIDPTVHGVATGMTVQCVFAAIFNWSIAKSMKIEEKRRWVAAVLGLAYPVILGAVMLVGWLCRGR